MKRKIKAILYATLLLAVGMLSACSGSEGATETHTLPDVKIGETFEITVKSPGSTGYKWSYEIQSRSGIEFVDREYIPYYPDNMTPDGEHIDGGGGTEIYTYRATKAGRFEIVFTYQRSWDPKTKQTYLYKIKVEK